MDALLRRRQMMLEGGEPPEPAVPEFYDRLVFDGTAYIDTDIIPEALSSFRVRVGNETLKAAQRIFMMAAGNNSLGVMLNSNTTSTTRSLAAYYALSSAVATNKTISFSTAEYNLFLTPNRFGWGSSTVAASGGTTAPTSAIVIGLNSSHSGQPFTGEMGTFEVYGSDAKDVTSFSGFSSYTPVATLRPCRYRGAAGLWCMETSKFYPNSAGAGSLSVRNLT